ncbi:winged helix-turn-helix transcriptional regulator [Chitinophaga nivalis]|uniref:Helix-turn-helix transcriptional regulator n=1 Tax=Chitinophaga nivalis TaxID=2991709 RepID=A0ABT3IKQ0_9BACT|nr:helix-turn-helix domain-containing protein [Chitinophaga nivalis]MCW3465779.1 helix-turn-helix transcriptional regulator [Chitinophaga nivalis]MCW3484530.1 helix-turn-helix transcriptional regulator [Chitinophaga nivalis]
MIKQEGTLALPGNTEVTNSQPSTFAGEKKFQEIFQVANTTRNQLCPVRDIVARISDKWSMLAIFALGGFGTLRFNEMKHKIGDISQRMLTVTLRNLEADGLVTRTVFPEIPPRVEYQLTPLGYGLMQQFSLLADWATDNGEQILRCRQLQRNAS